MAQRTITEALVERLTDAGVRVIYGVPGGECNLDFIAAADKLGVRFVLTRNETAAAIMASVTAELTGTTGVAMTTRGPGLAAAVNGTAYAALDRAPLLLDRRRLRGRSDLREPPARRSGSAARAAHEGVVALARRQSARRARAAARERRVATAGARLSRSRGLAYSRRCAGRALPVARLGRTVRRPALDAAALRRARDLLARAHAAARARGPAGAAAGPPRRAARAARGQTRAGAHHLQGEGRRFRSRSARARPLHRRRRGGARDARGRSAAAVRFRPGRGAAATLALRVDADRRAHRALRSSIRCSRRPPPWSATSARRSRALADSIHPQWDGRGDRGDEALGRAQRRA